MTETNKVLSQSDIDTLVAETHGYKQITLKAGAAGEVKSAPVEESVQAAPQITKLITPIHKDVQSDNLELNRPHEECTAAGEIQELNVRLTSLSERITIIDSLLYSLEDKIATIGKISPNEIKDAVNQMRNVSSQVEIISEGLRGTTGYNLNKTFKCGSCGTVGVVAMKVKCTKCGQENWWGWWPKNKTKESSQ